MANVFVKEGLGLRGIMTVSSFFRLHHGTVIKKLQACYGARIIEHHGFEGIVEMLMKITFLGLTLSEVPMTLDTSRRVGKSKMKILKTVLGYFSLLKAMPTWRVRAGEGVTQADADTKENEEINNFNVEEYLH